MFLLHGRCFILFFHFVNDFSGRIVVIGGIHHDVLFQAMKMISSSRMRQHGIVQQNNLPIYRIILVYQLMRRERSRLLKNSTSKFFHWVIEYLISRCFQSIIVGEKSEFRSIWYANDLSIRLFTCLLDSHLCVYLSWCTIIGKGE